MNQPPQNVTQPQQTIQQPPPSQSEESTSSSGQPNSLTPPAEFTEERIREYGKKKLESHFKKILIGRPFFLIVNQLYMTYTGRKGDPANTEWLVKSILSKEYTFGIAEKFVKFSKEAKAYQVL